MNDPDFGNKLSGFFACLAFEFFCTVLYGLWQHNGAVILFGIWLTAICFMIAAANAS
jgi:hypothetical protein